MIKKNQKRAWIGGGITALLLLLLIVYLCYLNAQRAVVTRKLISDIGSVISAIGNVQSDLRKIQLAEVKQQGFQQDKTIERAHLAADLNQHIRELLALTRDEPQQQKNLAEFMRIYSAWQTKASEADSAAAFYVDDLFQEDEALWGLLSTIRNDEKIRLQEQLGEIDHAQDMTNRLIAILLLASVTLLLIAFWQFFLQFRKDAEAKESSDKLIEQLKTSSEESAFQNSFSQALQLCTNLDDAYEVISGFIQSLFPETPGAIAFINNSRNLVSLPKKWGGEKDLRESFSPEACCAFRLSHIYRYPEEPYTLSCRHFEGQTPEAYFCLPLVAQGETIGLIHLQTHEWDRHRLKQLSLLADGAAMAIANLRLRDQLRSQSLRDPLTGLFNRRYLDSMISREIERSLRQKKNLGVLMIDIDHFKEVNDRFGHDVGDRVIKRIGEAMLGYFRDSDVVCRYGGEEFSVLLTDTDLTGASARCEGFRHEVSIMTWLMMPDKRVTISMGLALCPEHGQTPEELMRCADKALYHSKSAGRNKLTVATLQDELQVAAETL